MEAEIEIRVKVNDWCVPLIGWALMIMLAVVWLWGMLR